MMTARILRWKGGYGGDMIMYLMHLSGYKIANVIFRDAMDCQGRVTVDFSHVNQALTEIQKIALDRPFRDTIDEDRLIQEITAVDGMWIKSHHYTSLFDSITTDLVVDAKSLPFAIAANIIKTNTMTTKDFHPLAQRVQDPDIKIKLAFYNVGVDMLATLPLTKNQITVSDIISGWHTLEPRLQSLGLQMNRSAQLFYQQWSTNNRQYFASETYAHMVHAHDYDYTQRNLSLSERYALLILSGERFCILHDGSCSHG